jgi:hypothetical protein
MKCSDAHNNWNAKNAITSVSTKVSEWVELSESEWRQFFNFYAIQYTTYNIQQPDQVKLSNLFVCLTSSYSLHFQTDWMPTFFHLIFLLWVWFGKLHVEMHLIFLCCCNDSIFGCNSYKNFYEEIKITFLGIFCC